VRKRKNIDAVAIPLLLAVAAGIGLRVFVFDIFRVEGRSMEPALSSGSILLVNSAAYGIRNPWHGGYLLRWSVPGEEELIVYSDPRDGNFKVKRCAAVSGFGVFVRSDNLRNSRDSRLYGSIPVERIVGKVLLSIQR
jgi:signal peptidase I